MTQLVSKLYEAAWKNLIFSFNDEFGNPIPRTQRFELYNYLTKGIIPGDFLKALLVGNFNALFNVTASSLEKTRVFTIMDFIHTYLPSHTYGSERYVSEHASLVLTGEIGWIQRRYVDNTRDITKLDLVDVK